MTFKILQLTQEAKIKLLNELRVAGVIHKRLGRVNLKLLLGGLKNFLVLLEVVVEPLELFIDVLQVLLDESVEDFMLFIPSFRSDCASSFRLFLGMTLTVYFV